MTRAFVAIRPPAVVLDAVEARTAGVAFGRGRATTREQWHITVQFLGDAVDLDAVAGALSPPFAVDAGAARLGGAATFGPPRRARILMVGLAEGRELAARLATTVAARLEPLGVARADDDGSAFVPHLTLARYREPSDLRRVCAAIGPEPVGPAWRVADVVLFESELRADGARHTVRARFPLRE